MNSSSAFAFLVAAIVIWLAVSFFTARKSASASTDNNPSEKEDGANEINDLCVDESQKASTDNANNETRPLSVSSVAIESSINDLKAQIKELKDKQLSTVIKGVLWGLLIWSAISVIIFVIYANSHHSYY